MERFIVYLLQAALSLALLYGAYRLFIRKETFHRINRRILLGNLLFSLLLPLVSIPSIGHETAGVMSDLSSYLLPVVVVTDESTLAETAGSGASLNFWQLAGIIYLLVAAVLLLRLLFQLAGILRLMARSGGEKREGYRLVLSSKVGVPFSFFHTVFMNPDDMDRKEYQSILEHEAVHSRGWHSLDNLCAELYCIVFWFNPVSWWHKREILLNLEYLADSGALQKGHQRQSYQLQLLKAGVRDHSYLIANHFAQSIIKRRILMMNSKKSAPGRKWRYLMLLPAVAMALFLLNSTGTSQVLQREANNVGKKLEVVNDQEVQVLPDKENTGKPSNDGTHIEVVYDQEVDLDSVPKGKESGALEEVLAEPNDQVADFAKLKVKPQFPGGNGKIMDYIMENVQFPKAAKEAGIEGTVYVQFVIDKDGSIRDALAVRGEELGGGLPEEAVRVVENMPDWTPGEIDGKKTKVSYTLPIFFKNSDSEPASQNNDEGDVASFAVADVKPQFPGGNDKIMTWVSENFVYPPEAVEKSIQGTVYVQFVIDKDGSVTNVRCVRGEDLGGGLSEEAVRVVENMPNWTPGELDGKKVKVAYTLPIFARYQKPAEK